MATRRLLVAAHGTRGDVQPGFALAHALATAGHDVTILAPEGFASWATKLVRHIKVPIDMRAQVTTPAVQALLHAGSPRRFALLAQQVEDEADHGFWDTLVAASDGAEAIVAHHLLLERAAAVGEYRRLPVVPYCTLPVWRTRAFGSPVLGGPRWGALNPVSHSLFHWYAWRSQRETVRAWRQRLGLSAPKELFLTRMEREDLPSLEVYSSTLSPKPADWSESRIMTGLVRPPATLRAAMNEAALPEELETWLAAGPAPVFITFGSQPLLGRPGLVPDLLAALKARGLRGIFDMGWTPLSPAPNDAQTFWLRGVNHGALLPRCAAAMHHGGAGSTAAAAEAKIPSIVAAAVLDQPFWAHRIEALGAGRYVSYRRLNRETFGEALDAVLTDTTRQCAREVGSQIQAEDGLANISALVEQACRLG